MSNLCVRIREEYGLSRSAMGQVLGLGVNQWRLYEDGLVPTKSHQLLIISVSDPRMFRRMLSANKQAVVMAIGMVRYARLTLKLIAMVDEFDKLEADRYREWVASLWR